MRYILLIQFISCTLCSAQVVPKEKFAGYFDKSWNKIEDSSSASYYRTAEDKIRFYIVRNYFISGKLQMEAQADSYRPTLILNGKKTEYYENGNVKEEANYRKGYPDGPYRSFYENCILEKDINFADNVTVKSRFNAYYSSDSTDLLPAGNGIVPFEIDGEVAYNDIKDSSLVSSFVVEANGDTVYNVMDSQPEYEGGTTKLAKDISTQLVYPKIAKNDNEQGVVFVLFTVNEKGKVTNARAFKGFEKTCDAEAVRTISLLGRWVPARHKDKNVKARLIQPVQFARTVTELRGFNSTGPIIILNVVRLLVP